MEEKEGKIKGGIRTAPYNHGPLVCLYAQKRKWMLLYWTFTNLSLVMRGKKQSLLA